MKKQILLNEFKTRILVIFTSDVSIRKSLTLIKENENDEDKISFEVKTHRNRFAELSSNEIVKIFIEKFKLINIYKLRHIRDLTHDFYYDQNRIEIESDQIKSLKKIMRIFKNFEKFFYEIYFESFINYQLIVITFFAKSSSDIFVILIKFYQKILELAKLYD
jgi:hypothetical protein